MKTDASLMILPLSAAAVTLCFGSCNLDYSRSEIPSSPNIIYILVDDLGVGDIGCYGAERIKTPALDKMAEEGMRFTSHYSGSSVSAPSRASMLTGLHTGHCAIRALPTFAANGVVDLSDEDTTVAQELQRAGYSTAVIGKWGLAEVDMESMPSRRGFDYFYGYKTHREAHHYYPEYMWRNDEKIYFPNNDTQNTTGEYSHDLIAQEALTYIKEQGVKKNPFFLYLAFTLPHYELTVPEESKEQYRNLGWDERPMKRGHYRHDPEGNITYAGMVSRLDGDVGRVLDLLKEMKIDKNTIVFFASDNGPEYDKGRFLMSTGGLRGGKRDLYEGGIRTPMIAWWPSVVRNNTLNDHISAFWDFMPTACELAGIKPSKPTDGISMVATLTGRSDQKRHDYLYWELNQKEGPIQAARIGDWKVVKYLERPYELYNLMSDPKESHNVAESNPQIIEDFKRITSTGRSDNPNFPIDRKL